MTNSYSTPASPTPTRSALTIALLFGAFLAQNASAETLKYYRHMVFRESPVENLRGRYEIDAKTASTSISSPKRSSN